MTTNCIKTHQDFNVSANSFIGRCERQLTDEEKEQMFHECNVIRNELDTVVAICDYVIFNELHNIVYKILELNKANKYIIAKTKAYGDLVKVKKNASILVKRCYKSEACEITPYIAALFPYYFKEYSKDGGIFLTECCYKFSEDMKVSIRKLKSKIHKGVRNAKFDTDKTEFCTLIMLAELLCSTLNNILNSCTDKLAERVMDVIHNKWGQRQVQRKSLNFKTVPIAPYLAIHHHLNNLGDLMLGDKHITNNIHLEELKELMTEIADHLVNKNSAKIVDELMENAILDYTDYCIATMIVYFRKHGQLEPNVDAMIKGLGIGYEGVNALIMELQYSDICIGEDDPHEIKLYINDIKERKHIDLLRDMIRINGENKTEMLAEKWKETTYEYYE